MIYIPSSFTAILFPLLILIAVQPYITRCADWISRHFILVGLQFLFAGIYYVFHIKNILALELWSDEVISLNIAGQQFYKIAKEGLRIGMFPPLHYWGLWFLQKAYVHLSPQTIEFWYRVPPMTYHVVAALVFSAIIGRIISRNRSSRSLILIIRWLAFFAYFFNPLLFSYSLEVRPYVEMALGAVVTMAAIETGTAYSLEFLPLLCLFFLTSFFYAIYFIPFALYDWIQNKKKLQVLISVIVPVYLYAFVVPFIGKPISTTSLHFELKIAGALAAMQQLLFPNLVQGAVFVAILISNRKNTRVQVVFLQTAILLIVISILAYITRYIVFFPRHYILIAPLLLYLLFGAVRYKSKVWTYLGTTCLCFIFIVPWMFKVEKMLQKQQFYPKETIGIKTALLKAIQKRSTSIALEVNDDKKDSHYWDNQYYNYVAVWYIERYGYSTIHRITVNTLCQTAIRPSEFLITYGKHDCLHISNAASLQLRTLGR